MGNTIHMNYIEDERDKWLIQMDGKAARAIKESLLEDDMPKESVEQTMANAAEVLAYCPNPYTVESCQETGIVIGKVQSGKTSNFISLTALAFDNGYDVIVVLGGTKKILVEQNRDRIEQYFKKMANQEVAILDTVKNRDLINSRDIEQFVQNGKKVIIVALKNKSQISYIKDNLFENSYLAEKPTLIIDDEGDEASLNGLVSKSKKTATYGAIEGLKSVLSRHCFVSVTATPQANILISAIDILSPDFGILVNPGDGYCGLDVFHSDGTYIRPISEETDLSGKGIPESFLKALSHFFVACAINKSRGEDSSKKLSMLVHESPLVKNHKVEHDKINSVLKQWQTMSSRKKDVAYGDLQKKLRAAYEDYVESGVKVPDFSKIEDDMIQAIQSCHVHIVNGQNATNGNDKYYEYNIYVGGALLGRGLTIKGLVVTYISRTPKGKATVDTSEQRARWFGYKRNILDLCRLYMVPKLESEFMDIRDHEEDLWDTVREAQLQGTKFKDIVRIFSLNDTTLRPTRSSVVQTETFKFTHWSKQRYFQDNLYDLTNNVHVINELKQVHGEQLEVLKYGSGAPYTVLHSDFRTIKDILIDKFIFPSEEPKLNKQIVVRLMKEMRKYNMNPMLDVIWMRDVTGNTSDHEIKEGNRIPNYSVGRRPKEKDKPEIYAGDDYQFRKDGVMQLQIHNIRDKQRDIVSPTLALYIPPDIVGKIANLIYRA